MTTTTTNSRMKPTLAAENAATMEWSRTTSATGSAPKRLTPAHAYVCHAGAVMV